MQTRIVLALAFAASLAGCANRAPGISVDGVVGDERIETTVDSEIARYYLRSPLLPAASRDPRWDRRIAALHDRFGQRVPTSEEAAVIARDFSLDFAALFLARQLLRGSAADAMVTAYRDALGTARSGAAADDEPLRRTLFLFVPGWLHHADPSSGADLRRQREMLARLGAAVAVAPIEENVAVERNAALIASEIRRLAALHDTIVLVSASKGGPEAGLALTQLGDWPGVAKVRAWINIGGTLRGTPLADLALTWPACWFVQAFVLPDGSFEGIRSLATARSRHRYSQIAVPRHVRVISVLGIPLSGQVSARARDGYARLNGDGPNDGIMLIGDALLPNASHIVEVGVDHFFSVPDADLRTRALAGVVARAVHQGSDAGDVSTP